MIKAIGLFDPSVRSIVGDLGQHPEYSNARAREELGWSPAPARGLDRRYRRGA